MQVHPSAITTTSNNNKDEIHVISFEGCPYAQRTRVQLEIKGIPFKITNIDLKNKPQWLLEMNPLGKVPVVQHGDKILFESAVIVDYFEDLFASDPRVPQLLPRDAYHRAVARFWIDFANTKLLPATNKLIFENEAEKQVPLRADVLAQFKFLSDHGLKNWKGPYFFGDQYSTVDVIYAPFFALIDAVWKYYRNFDTSEENVGAAVAQWSKNIQQHEGFKKTAYDPQFLINMYRAFVEGKH